MYNLDKLQIRVLVPTHIASKLILGSQAIIKTAGNRSEIKVPVTSLGSAIDMNSQQLPVFLSLEGINHDLRLNEFVSVNFLLPELSNVIEVPLHLINDRLVWVRKANGILRKELVNIMWTDNQTAWVASSLKAGDKVVAHTIPDGLEGRLSNISEVSI